MKENYNSSNKKLAKNTLFLYIRMIFVLVIALYTSRVILRTLGVEDYGIFNVIAGFVSLFSFLNASLSSSIQRFYNYEEIKNGCEGVQKVYSAGILIHLLLGLLLFVLLESIGFWYVNYVMVIPTSRLFAANILFQFSIGSLFFTLFQTPFLGILLSKEKMDFYAILSILDIVLKFVIVLILGYLNTDYLILYGFLLFLVTINIFMCYYFYCKKNFKELKFNKRIEKKIFYEMLSFSGWNLVGTFAFMLKNQGVNMVLNFFFGPIINAARGIAVQVSNAVCSFTSNVFLAFRPQLTQSYADSNYQRTKQIMFFESKICFALMTFIIIPVIININPLLEFWLGNNVPKYTSIFAILILIDALIGTLNTPCTQVIQATGKIKKYQIYSSIINVLLIPVCCVVLYCFNNVLLPFIVTILFSIINQCFCIVITNQEFCFGLDDYIRRVLCPCIIYIMVIPILPYLSSLYFRPSLGSFFIISIITFLVVVIFAYLIMMNSEERISVKKFLSIKFNNYEKK